MGGGGGGRSLDFWSLKPVQDDDIEVSVAQLNLQLTFSMIDCHLPYLPSV